MKKVYFMFLLTFLDKYYDMGTKRPCCRMVIVNALHQNQSGPQKTEEKE